MFLPGFHIAMGGLSAGFDGEAETVAWIADVVSNGGTVSDARAALVDDLIVALKADGVWTKLDRLWLFAAENQPSALTDLVALDLATAVNSPSFTADQGYTGNGSTSYVNTTYNPTTDAVSYALNSASVSFWGRTNRASNSTEQIGAVSGSGAFIDVFEGNTLWFFINTNSFSSVPNTLGSDGFFTLNRSGSAGANVQVYRNGSSVLISICGCL